MKPNSTAVVHAVPGRIRVKVPRLRENPALEHEIRMHLAQIEAIDRVEVNSLTGSVLLEFDQDSVMNVDSLLSLSRTLTSVFPDLKPDLASLSEFLVSSDSGGPRDASPSFVRPGEFWFGGSSSGAQAEAIDFSTLLPMTLFALGMHSLIVSNRTPFPCWYEFFWYAFSTYHLMNHKRTTSVLSSRLIMKKGVGD